MYMMKLQTDLIVGAGLVIALLASIFTGGSVELQTTIGSGLIGYLGRVVQEHREKEGFYEGIYKSRPCAQRES